MDHEAEFPLEPVFLHNFLSIAPLMLGILISLSTRSESLETCSEGLAVARHTD